MPGAKLKRLSETNGTEFSQVLDMDIRNSFGVLSAEYDTDEPGEIHRRQHTRLENRCRLFPQGQVIAYEMGLDLADRPVLRPVGLSCSLRLDVDRAEGLPTTWNTITGYGMFSTHRPNGIALVCAPMCWNEYAVFSMLLDFQYGVAKRNNIKKMLVLSRAEDYDRYAKDVCIDMSFERYAGIRHDKSLSAYALHGAKLARTLENGRNDPESRNNVVVFDCSHLLK